MTLSDLIRHYREVEARATPGPWLRDPLYWTMRIVEKSGYDVGENLPDDALWPRRDDAQFIVNMRNLFAALLDVAEAALRIQREATEAGWKDAAGWDMAELNAPMQSNDKALDRLRAAMEANRG